MLGAINDSAWASLHTHKKAHTTSPEFSVQPKNCSRHVGSSSPSTSIHCPNSGSLVGNAQKYTLISTFWHRTHILRLTPKANQPNSYHTACAPSAVLNKSKKKTKNSTDKHAQQTPHREKSSKKDATRSNLARDCATSYINCTPHQCMFGWWWWWHHRMANVVNRRTAGLTNTTSIFCFHSTKLAHQLGKQ